MEFYERNIKFYKQFKLIDTDGDGVKDTITYSPVSSNYYLQIGLNQDVKDIGYYFSDDSDDSDFEVIDLGDLPSNPSDTEPLDLTNQISDDYYDGGPTPPSVPKTKKTTLKDLNIDCLTIYTDWGPWNNSILLNDTQQKYVVKTECLLTFRLINLLATTNYNNSKPIDGGWYGAHIKIEINEGNGFKTLDVSSSYVYDLDTDIEFNTSNNGYTLDKSVRIWEASKSNTSYYTTKPFRDLTIKPPKGSVLRISYLNPTQNTQDYNNYAKYLRLQVIKGNNTDVKPKNPVLSLETPTEWHQNTPQINTYLGTINNRISDGETFHYITSDKTKLSGLKTTIWLNYLNGYSNKTTTLPWGDNNVGVFSGYFYNLEGVSNLYDFGKDNESTILSDSKNQSLNYFQNPEETLTEFNFDCLVQDNLVSYYDKNGDGFIEYEPSYPNNSGSVDLGLFSKTRYDSPYVYLKPGTKDGVSPLDDNDLLTTTDNGNNVPTSFASPAGWRDYAYIGVGGNPSIGGIKYSFAKTSPTCQLGGVDNLPNTNNELVDPDNYNLFLPQSDYGLNDDPNQANFGTGTTINHVWNQGLSDAKGGCCAKHYDSTLVFSTQGPYLDNECSTCHMQMTTRSAQPVLDNSVKIAMQTTDSEVYYGPFYDPSNPTYNGYGLAFSKANTFCRNVKGKNGVEVINSDAGTEGNYLFIGGILHGGGSQINPNTDLNQNLGVYYDVNSFTNVNSNKTSCPSGTKLPLKCTKVVKDPNCPKDNCIKCVYCFKCITDSIKSGVFTGKQNIQTNGATNGITIINQY